MADSDDQDEEGKNDPTSSFDGSDIKKHPARSPAAIEKELRQRSIARLNAGFFQQP